MAKKTIACGDSFTLTAANIKYLITMLRLGQDQATSDETESSKRRGVRGIEIASELGIAKPSAHTMLENLADRGLIEKDRYGAAFLTVTGCDTAERYSDYFELLFKTHKGLFKDRKEALGPICSMLAELSAESLQAMDRVVIHAQGVGCP